MGVFRNQVACVLFRAREEIFCIIKIKWSYLTALGLGSCNYNYGSIQFRLLLLFFCIKSTKYPFLFYMTTAMYFPSDLHSQIGFCMWEFDVKWRWWWASLTSMGSLFQRLKNNVLLYHQDIFPCVFSPRFSYAQLQSLVRQMDWFEDRIKLPKLQTSNYKKEIIYFIVNQNSNLSHSLYIPKANCIIIRSGKHCLPRTMLCPTGVDILALFFKIFPIVQVYRQKL